MTTRFLQAFVFVVASMIQVTLVDAKDYVIPSEDPKDCLKHSVFPCSVTTGDTPRMFHRNENLWELDREIVLQAKTKGVWNLYSGMLVVEGQNEIQLHTPFADIFVEQSKVMIHVLEDRVRVMALNGKGVKVKAKGDPDEHYIVPGFQNWFGGVKKGMASSGVVSVIDFHEYSQARSGFFMNHSLGFVKELEQVAKVVKWAAKIAAQMHRDLVERKMASLEEEHQESIVRQRKKVNFNKYLRRLFLKKIRYDY